MKKLLCILSILVPFMTTTSVKAEKNNSTVLVAYFSATGVTAGVAEKLAKAINADLFEIKPEKPYTKEDLDWTNKKSRTSIERKDKTLRPQIASQVEDMSQYKTIFLGSPIWWGRAPAIINTFIESYDFKGKTIIPFVTSDTSGIGSYGPRLQNLLPNATVLPGDRFEADVTESELKAWANKQM